MERPVRKGGRLPDYDYSQPGVYFVTLCTYDRREIFWDAVGASSARPQIARLSPAGEAVRREIDTISASYPAVSIDNYSIMPDHVHILLRIDCDESGRAMLAPTVSTVVQQLKGRVSKKLGAGVWQKSFYDHIIRSESDYKETWEYIESNPSKWLEKKLNK